MRLEELDGQEWDLLERFDIGDGHIEMVAKFTVHFVVFVLQTEHLERGFFELLV